MTCYIPVSSCRLIIRWVPISRLPGGIRKIIDAIQSARRIWSISAYLGSNMQPGQTSKPEGPVESGRGSYLHICKGENSRDSNLQAVTRLSSMEYKQRGVSTLSIFGCATARHLKYNLVYLEARLNCVLKSH